MGISDHQVGGNIHRQAMFKAIASIAIAAHRTAINSSRLRATNRVLPFEILRLLAKTDRRTRGHAASRLDKNRKDIHTLFVVSPVVFSHGSPALDEFTVSAWPVALDLIDKFVNWANVGKGLQRKFMQSVGDITDDIRDSWGSSENSSEAEMILSILFGTQNESKDNPAVVILSGDIHTSGFAAVYSRDPNHARRSTIPHITSSSVSYSPFNWFVEAVYRNATKSVELGTTGTFRSQISHHFCYRSVAVLSVRQQGEYGSLLKAKYYLEGFPEPQILQFDLNKVSHRENITWVAQDKVSVQKYAPISQVNIQELRSERSKKNAAKLNDDDSIIDLLKMLGMESDLGSRKQMAVAFQYPGALDGSREMNLWLLQEVKKRLQ